MGNLHPVLCAWRFHEQGSKRWLNLTMVLNVFLCAPRLSIYFLVRVMSQLHCQCLNFPSSRWMPLPWSLPLPPPANPRTSCFALRCTNQHNSTPCTANHYKKEKKKKIQPQQHNILAWQLHVYNQSAHRQHCPPQQVDWPQRLNNNDGRIPGTNACQMPSCNECGGNTKPTHICEWPETYPK